MAAVKKIPLPIHIFYCVIDARFFILLIYGSSIHETDDDDDEMRALFILCKIIETIPIDCGCCMK